MHALGVLCWGIAFGWVATQSVIDVGSGRTPRWWSVPQGCLLVAALIGARVWL